MNRESRLLLAPVAAIGVASAILYGLGFSLAGDLPATKFFPALYYPLLCAYAVAVLWVFRHPGVSLKLIVGFAIVFRLLAATDAPALSSDAYRYAWDGMVQRAGTSPYRYAPGDERLAHLADGTINPRINRPRARTVYPPLAQALFRVLPFNIDGVRLFMIAADVVTILLVALLLWRRRLDPSRVILYAWAPLLVYEVGNGGHLEAAMLPLLVAAVLAYRSERFRLTGVFVGAAAALKLYPVIALAALARRAPVRVILPAAAVITLGYLVYAPGVGTDVLGFLPSYVGSAEDHNIGLRAALEWIIGALVPRDLAGYEPHHGRAIAFGICLALMCVGLHYVYRMRAPIEHRLLSVVGVFLLTLPTAFHPWYALWLLPWLCFHPTAAWLWLLAALPLSYLKYASPAGLMPAWVVPVELLPTAGLLLIERRRAA